MKELAMAVNYEIIPQGKLGVYFLGQAGFAVKTDTGVKVAIDPYLSDCCNRYCGFKRLMPFVLTPDEVIFDLLITSHVHYDHFDVDSIPVLMQNGWTRLIAAPDAEVGGD